MGAKMGIRGWGSISGWRLAICSGLVAIADHFFYGHDVGWTLGLFCFLLLTVSALYSPSAVRQPASWALLLICLGLCAVLVETVNWLAFALFWFVFAALFTRMRLSHPTHLAAGRGENVSCFIDCRC
jgi:hypothetical protein